MRLGKQDLAPTLPHLSDLPLALQLLGARGTYEGHSQRIRDEFCAHLPSNPSFIAAIAQRDPSVEAFRAQQHPSNSPSERMFYDQSRYYEMPSAFHTRSSFFFPVSCLAHSQTWMFQIKCKLRTTKISLLIATIVPNKSPMLPPSATPTTQHPPSTDRWT